MGSDRAGYRGYERSPSRGGGGRKAAVRCVWKKKKKKEIASSSAKFRAVHNNNRARGLCVRNFPARFRVFCRRFKTRTRITVYLPRAAQRPALLPTRLCCGLSERAPFQKRRRSSVSKRCGDRWKKKNKKFYRRSVWRLTREAKQEPRSARSRIIIITY